jgi:hypothetical protein
MAQMIKWLVEGGANYNQRAESLAAGSIREGLASYRVMQAPAESFGDYSGNLGTGRKLR